MVNLSYKIKYFYALGAAIVLGISIVSNNDMILAGIVGCLAGIILLAYPKLTFWLLLAGAFVVSGCQQMFFPELSKLKWIFILLSFFLAAESLIYFSLKKGVTSYPKFVWLIILLPVASLLFSVFSGAAPTEIIAGFKRYYQMWGIFTALSLLPLLNKDMLNLKKFMALILLLQLPFSLFELIHLVPIREAMRYADPMLVPVDIIAGTFGGIMTGGGANKEMVAFLTIGLAVILSAWQSRLITSTQLIVWGVFCIVPHFLGETKISLFILPLPFIIVFSKNISKSFVRNILLFMVMISLLYIILSVYVHLYGQGMGAAEWIDSIFNANFGESGRDEYALNRLTVLPFWLSENFGDWLHFLFGHGLGSSYSGEGGMIVGSVHAKYPTMGIGMTSLAGMLWDTGLIGTGLVVIILFKGFTCSRMLIKHTIDNWEKAYLQGVQVSIIVFAIMIFATPSFTRQMAFQALFSVVFGFLCVSSLKQSKNGGEKV